MQETDEDGENTLDERSAGVEAVCIMCWVLAPVEELQGKLEATHEKYFGH